MKLSILVAFGFLALFTATANAAPPTAGVDVLPSDQPVKEVDDPTVVAVDPVLIDSKDLVPVDDGTGTHFEYPPISANDGSTLVDPPVLKDDGTGTYYFPTVLPGDGGINDTPDVIYYATMPDSISDPILTTPEPGSWLLLATAGAVGFWRRPRSKLAA